MTLKKLTLRAAPEDKGKRLDQFLADRLPSALGEEVSKGKVRKLVVAGAVYINNHRVRIASKAVLPGARVDVYVDQQKMNAGGPSKDVSFEMRPELILFEDEYLIAVNKPYGLPTQPTLDEARENLYAAVKKFVAKRDGDPQAYVGLHHRLDRDTSGVILFTKKPEANAGVADLFTKHIAEKTYNALTGPFQGELLDEWSVKNYLGKAPGGGKRTRFTAVRSGGDFAHTDFRVLERCARGLWIEAKPRTGRTHQIRVHLSEYGLPILADPTYGSRAVGSSGRVTAPRLMLHAVSLTFPHPIHKNQISIQSPIPEDFTQCLQRLRGRL